MLKVLKGLAEYLDMSLGDLLEGITLASFEGRSPFVAATIAKIDQLKEVYGMDYGADRSGRSRSRLPERESATGRAPFFTTPINPGRSGVLQPLTRISARSNSSTSAPISTR